MDQERTIDDEIRDVSADRPHLVILGAGASRAACPSGDASGRQLPVMADLFEMLRLDDVVDRSALKEAGENFEAIYSRLAGDPDFSVAQSKIDERISAYFAELELPSQPTIYDQLVLSLRHKDVIATFNWDPFLWQALRRNASVSRPPQFFFLHGCAIVGYCEADKTQGRTGTNCLKCDRPNKATRLLYPIADKDYVKDPYLASQWSSVSGALAQAFVVTVFGYSAPEADAAALDLLRKAWGSPDTRQFEEFEFIDIRPEAELSDRWEEFIFGGHSRCSVSFADSIIGRHPRRSCEAMHCELIEAEFLPDNRPPEFASLEEAHAWFRPLLDAERAA